MHIAAMPRLRWLALLIAVPTALDAQARHRVSGVVLDSLRGRPLARAEVVLEGTVHATVTDSLGRFAFDSLEAGTYRIGFFHDYLDSLGIAIGARVLPVPLDSGVAAVLAVPSVATITSSLCPAAERGTSVLVGRVLDPDTHEPRAGTRVFLSWTDFVADARRGLVWTPRTLHSVTDSTGAYRLCGLPPDLDALLAASLGPASTAAISLSSAGQAVLHRTLGLSADTASAALNRAALSGTIRNADGDPLSGAKISVPGSAATATSSGSGHYSLSGLPLGTRNVVVRRVGYVPATIPVDLSSRAESRVDARLEKYVSMMDTVFVRARRERSLARVGFSDRRSRGIGQFVTREEFEHSNPRYLSDIVGMMHGIRIDYYEGRRVIGGSRAVGCVHMVVDGVHWESFQPGDSDDLVFPDDIAAIEVYSGATVPPEFERFGARGCPTIVVWTRGRIRDI